MNNLKLRISCKAISFNIFLYLALLLNISMVIFFVLYTYHLNSDDAVKMILAKEIIETGNLLPRDWYYVNGDVWIIFIHLLCVPLIELFGFNYTTYSLNAFIYTAIYFSSAIYLLNSLKISFYLKLLYLNLICLPLAASFGDTAYMVIYIVEFLLLGILIRFYNGYLSFKLASIFLGTLVFAYAIHNPSRYLIYLLIPFLAICGYMWYSNRFDKKINVMLCIIIMGSFLLSTALYKVIGINLHIVHGASNLMLANYDSFIKNLNIFFDGFLFTYGIAQHDQISPTSVGGLIRLLYFSFFSLLMYSIIKNIRDGSQDIGKLIVNVYFIVCGGLVLFFYIFMVPLAQNVGTFRYFYHLVILSFIYIIFFVSQLNFSISKVIIFIVVSFIVVVNYYTYVLPHKQGSSNIHYELVKPLQERNLKYGFASYWHSHVTTVLSGGIEVYPIHLHDYSPFRWLSSERWYTSDKERNFVIFTSDEFSKFSGSLFEKIYPKEVIHLREFKIAVFNEDVLKEIKKIYSKQQLETIKNEAKFDYESGNLELAKENYLKYLSIINEQVNSNQQDVVETKTVLADIYEKQGKFSNALELVLQLIQKTPSHSYLILEKYLHKRLILNHKQLILNQKLNNLKEIAQAQIALDEFYLSCYYSNEICRKELGENGLNLIEIIEQILLKNLERSNLIEQQLAEDYLQLSYFYTRNQSWEKAKNNYQKTIDLFTKLDNKPKLIESYLTFLSYIALSGSQQNLFKEIEIRLKIVELCKETRNVEQLKVEYQKLIELYDLLGQEDKAQEFRNDLTQIN